MKIVLAVGEPGYGDQDTANAALDQRAPEAVMYRDGLAGDLVKQYAVDNGLTWYSVPDAWLQPGYIASANWMDEFTPAELLVLPTALDVSALVAKAASHGVSVWVATGSVGGGDLVVAPA